MDKRRAVAGRGQLPPVGTNALAPTAFRQALARCHQRLSRQGREFSIIALAILEYAEVERSLGSEAASRLDHLAMTICRRNLRNADRFCNVQPGHILAILPDTLAYEAALVSNRLSGLIAKGSVAYKHEKLRASCATSFAHSGAHGGDPEGMLTELGFRLDEKDELVSACSPADEAASRSNAAAFLGSFAAWWARYSLPDSPQAVSTEAASRQAVAGEPLKVTVFVAGDVWSVGLPVRMRIIESLDGRGFDAATIDTLKRRTRVLRSIDHPGVAHILDFHLRERRMLYLVTQVHDSPTLHEFLRQWNQPDALPIVDWALQICNSLIYLQSTMPPVVPPALTEDSFLVAAANQLVLVDYELPYLFPLCHRSIQLSELELQAISQGRPAPAYEPVIRSFAALMSALIDKQKCAAEQALFVRLRQKQLPNELNTVYKIRSALREISDKDIVERI